MIMQFKLHKTPLSLARGQIDEKSHYGKACRHKTVFFCLSVQWIVVLRHMLIGFAVFRMRWPWQANRRRLFRGSCECWKRWSIEQRWRIAWSVELFQSFRFLVPKSDDPASSFLEDTRIQSTRFFSWRESKYCLLPVGYQCTLMSRLWNIPLPRVY